MSASYPATLIGRFVVTNARFVIRRRENRWTAAIWKLRCDRISSRHFSRHLVEVVDELNQFHDNQSRQQGHAGAFHVPLADLLTESLNRERCV